MPVRFSRDELKRFAGKTLPDLISPDVRLLFVGINPACAASRSRQPSLRAAIGSIPALFQAGITDHLIYVGRLHRHRPRVSVAPRNRHHRPGRAATASAAELTVGELVKGKQRLSTLVAKFSPRVVAVLGITAYRAAFNDPAAQLGNSPALTLPPNCGGPQPEWRNAHASVAGLAAAYGEVARAAGIEVDR